MPLPILLLDGGLGTTLESPPCNIHFSSSTPLWSSHLLVSSPKILSNVQQDFVRKGVDVLLTATYQASFEGFAATPRESSQSSEADDNENGKVRDAAEDPKSKAGYDRNEAAALMCSAVSIAHSATTQSLRKTLVALSIGAYGATMRPSQEYTGAYLPSMLATPNLQSWHADRLSVFTSHPNTWNSIDLVAFETLPLLAEIKAARRVMAEVSSKADQKRLWISCVFPNEDLRLPDGSNVRQVAEAMVADGGMEEQVPWGIGVNCTKVGKLRGLVREFEDAVGALVEEGRAKCEWPWLVLYPDGAQGLVYNTSTHAWEAKDGDERVENKRTWDEEVFEILVEISKRRRWEGVLVGGCCKTSPEDIGNLRKRIDELETEQV